MTQTAILITLIAIYWEVAEPGASLGGFVVLLAAGLGLLDSIMRDGAKNEAK